jgi:Flp pilus assembly pilin Flp
MRHLTLRTLAFLRDESGQDLVEYGLIALLISVVVVTLLIEIEGGIDRLWSTILTELRSHL